MIRDGLLQWDSAVRVQILLNSTEGCAEFPNFPDLSIYLSMHIYAHIYHFSKSGPHSIDQANLKTHNPPAS